MTMERLAGAADFKRLAEGVNLDKLAVCARGYSFAYAGQPLVLDAVDWQVEQGSFALVVGRTGSGKSTLLRNLKPELAPLGRRSGELFVLGRAVSTWASGESAAAVGYVAQSPENQIVCDEVWHELAFGLENIGCKPDIMRRRVAESAQFFGIEEWMHRKTADLSGGQQQLVNLASAFAMRPRLLVLDEPTAQLDPVAEKSFLHELFRMNRELGITVLVATHSPGAMISYATCAFVMDEKRVVPRALPDVARMCDFSFARPCRAQALGGACEADGGRALKGAPATDVRSATGEPEPDCSLEPDSSSSGGSRRSFFGARRTRSARADSLVCDDVFFRYEKGAPWVLKGLDFCAEQGKVHVVVGGNGAGKSTLLRMAACSFSPERGRVRNPWVHAQALMPQNPKTLFVCDSAYDELMEWSCYCDYGSARAKAMANSLGIEHCLAQHPYDLSGGEQQLLAFAKVLLANPSLLLLDEPAKGLDVSAKRRVAELLVASAEDGVAVVCSTHDLDFAAAVADNVSMLFDGQIVCTDSAEGFFRDNLFYRPARNAFVEGGACTDDAPCAECTCASAPGAAAAPGVLEAPDVGEARGECYGG